MDNIQILSLDGGGIKGVFSAAILAAIEDDYKVRIIDHFDLIAGTSTGGIIAIALGLGMRPREIVNLYMNDGESIFDLSLVGWVSQLFRRKYSPKNLESTLKQYFQDKRLGDSTKRLLIPSYNLDDNDVYIFRTSHAERLRRDYKVPAWKVARATSAAPTYFPVCKEVENIRMIDGGVWANNPIMSAITESFGTLGVKLENTKVLSIGTFSEVESHTKSLDYGGKLPWIKNARIVDLLMRAQGISATNQARFLIGKNNVCRINPDVPKGLFNLDGAEKVDKLIAKASHFSRIHAPQVAEMFFTHHAPDFTPIHK
jgi:patatin-like phospholipase/acyl hydrolase